MPKISKSQLIKLQKELGTDEAIGDKFGITRQAVHQLRKRLGVGSLREKNPQRNERILAMYEKGKTAQEIAERFDISLSQTFRIIGALRSRRKRKK
jgi:DNA invertase Pin-like site-specific DNA recombinase